MRRLGFTELKLQCGTAELLHAGSVVAVAFLSQAVLGTSSALTHLCRINDAWKAMQW